MKGKKLQTGLAIGGVVLLVALAIALWQSGWLRVFGDREALLRLIATLGPWGPVAIVLAEVLQVLLAPIPGQVVGIVAGYLYGALWGTVYCLVGLIIGTFLAIWLARRLGRPLVERLAGRGAIPPELLARIDAYAQRHGVQAFFLVLLLPFLPDDLICFLVGLTKLPIGALMLVTVPGRAPGVLVSTLLGATATSLTWPQIALLSVAVLLGVLLLLRYQRALERAMFALIDRVTEKR